jgi:uncharacterized protein YggE
MLTKTLKRLALQIGVVTILSGAILTTATAQAASNPAAAPLAAQAATPANTITVSGYGQANGKPNVATLQVGVETFDRDASKALVAANAAIARVTDAMIAAGVASTDIQTQNFNLFSTTPPTDPGKAPNAADRLYQAQIMITVKVRDITKTGDVIDKGIQAGVTNIYGLNFTIDDTTKLESDARAKAIQDARRRAEELARILGVKLGDPLIIQEGISNGPTPLMDVRMAVPGGNGQISEGQLSVGVSVQITYAISK